MQSCLVSTLFFSFVDTDRERTGVHAGGEFECTDAEST